MLAKRKSSVGIRLFVALLVALTFFGFLSISSNLAVANESGDTRFQRYTDNSGGDYVTPGRQKTDNTSSYAYNDQSTLRIYVRGVGSYTTGNGAYYTDTILDMIWLNVGNWSYIQQYVYEHDYPYARLLVTPGSHNPTWISFLWSPDSY
jgi:hypothetical protein